MLADLLSVVLGVGQEGRDVEHDLVALVYRVHRVSPRHVTYTHTG